MSKPGPRQSIPLGAEDLFEEQQARWPARKEREESEGSQRVVLLGLLLAALDVRSKATVHYAEVNRALGLFWNIEIDRARVKRIAESLGLTVSRSGRRIMKGPVLQAAVARMLRESAMVLEVPPGLAKTVRIAGWQGSVERFRDDLREVCREVIVTGPRLRWGKRVAFNEVCDRLRLRWGLLNPNLASGQLIGSRCRELGLTLHTAGGHTWIMWDPRFREIVKPKLPVSSSSSNK